MSEPESFAICIRNAIKGDFHPCMRRSIQSIALYEADRCLLPRYPHLKPFQKKFALFATAVELLNTLDFLSDYYRVEIMFRTQASKEPLAPDLAWRRMRTIEREIKTSVLPKVKELMDSDEGSGKSHEEICDMVLQKEFEDSTQSFRAHPPFWEFNRYSVFLVYRIYYRGLNINPNIFPATPVRTVSVPEKKPANIREFARRMDTEMNENTVGGHMSMHPGVASAGVGLSVKGTSEIGVVRVDAASIPDISNMTIGVSGNYHNADVTDEERRALLKEVKEHTELLKEFEGVISDEELAQRKRALYMALPPVPPPANRRLRPEGRGGNIGNAAGGRRRGGRMGNGQGEASQQKKKARAEAATDNIVNNSHPAMEVEDWEKVGSGSEEKLEVMESTII